MPARPARRPRVALLRAAALAALGVTAVLLPRPFAALGAPVAVRSGSLTPTWLAPAAFVHPGRAVSLPQAGRLLALAAAGMVPAGASLASFAPLAASGVAALPPTPAGALGCLSRACAGARRAALPRPRSAAVAAGGSGWFSPGWDPLAALPPAAYSDLPPAAVLLPPGPVPARGMALPRGAPLGDLGEPFRGYWLCVLPAAAGAAVRAADSASLAWPGGAAPMAVQPVGMGPAVAGRLVGIFVAGALGPDPGPPRRTEVRLTLPPVAGEIVPRAALLRGGATVLAVGAGGRARPVPVRELAAAGTLAVVAGLAPGTRVLSRPWRDPLAAAGSL